MSDPYSIPRIASYKLVDESIRAWVAEHHLNLCTDYKDYDVRSVDVVGPEGKQCQIWIDPPKGDSVVVNVWPYGPPHEKWEVPIEDIRATLERAWQRAVEHVGLPWQP